MTITKAERGELRSIVRQQFRVLKSEIDQREAEMTAEVEERLVNRFSASDAHRAAVESKIAAIVSEAQSQIDALVDAEAEQINTEGRDGYLHHTQLGMPRIAWAQSDRVQFRRALSAEVDAITSNAKAQLARQEADLLRSLALGSIESDAAKAFLDSIPTVAQLVPSHRLAELERAWEQGAIEPPHGDDV